MTDPGSYEAVAARRHYEPGTRLRITFEAELLRVEQASGNRGVARLILRAGAGMNDSVWLVREPDFGTVLVVQEVPS